MSDSIPRREAPEGFSNNGCISKSGILEQIDQIREFLGSDVEALECREVMTFNEKQMKALYPFASDKEYVAHHDLHEQMNQCSQTYMEARTRLDQLVCTHFAEFTSETRYRKIYQGLLDDTLNYETLKDVIRQVDRYRRGEISYEQGFNRGLDFITRKSNLPQDFFNRMKEN